MEGIHRHRECETGWGTRLLITLRMPTTNLDKALSVEKTCCECAFCQLEERTLSSRHSEIGNFFSYIFACLKQTTDSSTPLLTRLTIFCDYDEDSKAGATALDLHMSSKLSAMMSRA
jgi:hypothetical protein